ncbi:MAG: peptide chain release factor N(5)-glutamine methyltransferase [Dehalococcoidales bacterium]|nr:peptide chain release factor N(5)-glutamine methyltransferase [Dehalococcoidales bacterium]
MTVKEALSLARAKLIRGKDVEDPVLESEVLLRYALQMSRAHLLFLGPGETLDPSRENIFFDWIDRRLQGEPVAYIIECREFFGLDLYVDRRVLIPRPETELLVEECINFARHHPAASIADIGTGSGAIAASLAVTLPHVKIFASDISKDALEVAGINCRKHDVADRVTLLQGDLLDPLPGPVDILAANLPYVKLTDLAGMPSARFEPEIALDGGPDGLDQISRFIPQIEGKVNPGGCVLLEIGKGQGRPTVDLLRRYFPHAPVEIKRDLAGIERVIKITIRGEGGGIRIND